jgi:mRNA interferase MazF
VLLPYPHTDLSPGKLRPCLLLANADRGDWIVCQITSNPFADKRCILLTSNSFVRGGLVRDSYLRPTKLFTANESLIAGTVGSLNPAMFESVRDAVVVIIRGVSP